MIFLKDLVTYSIFLLVILMGSTGLYMTYLNRKNYCDRNINIELLRASYRKIVFGRRPNYQSRRLRMNRGRRS